MLIKTYFMLFIVGKSVKQYQYQQYQQFVGMVSFHSIAVALHEESKLKSNIIILPDCMRIEWMQGQSQFQA